MRNGDGELLIPIDHHKMIVAFMPDSNQPNYEDYHEETTIVDWNTLMPVVERIHDITSDHDINFAGLNIFECSIGTSLETVYQYIMQYIEWYNDKNK